MFRGAFRQVLRHSKLRNGSSAVISKQFHHLVTKKSSNVALITSITGITGYFLYENYLTKVQCAEPEKSLKRHQIIREDLPFFTEEELARHDNKYHIMKCPNVDTFDIIGNSWEIERESSIWVSYGVGIYDITKLYPKHGNPNESILLAAGTALDPFWEDEDMAKIHDKPYIYDMLERCRVGNLKVSEN